MRLCQLSLGLLTWFGTIPARADVSPPPSCGSTSSADITACSGKMAGGCLRFRKRNQRSCASLRCVTDLEPPNWPVSQQVPVPRLFVSGTMEKRRCGSACCFWYACSRLAPPSGTLALRQSANTIPGVPRPRREPRRYDVDMRLSRTLPLAVLVCIFAEPAQAKDSELYGSVVDGLRLGLTVTPSRSVLPSDLEVRITLQNTSSSRKSIPISTCHSISWASYARLLRVPTGKDLSDGVFPEWLIPRICIRTFR